MRRAAALAPALASVIALAGLAACGPIPVDEAERLCLDQAQDSVRPRGKVSIGVASDGHRTRTVSGVELSVSSDWIAGRDPSAVFDRCVMNRAGRMPTRPLAQQPGWAGY